MKIIFEKEYRKILFIHVFHDTQETNLKEIIFTLIAERDFI